MSKSEQGAYGVYWGGLLYPRLLLPQQHRSLEVAVKHFTYNEQRHGEQVRRSPIRRAPPRNKYLKNGPKLWFAKFHKESATRSIYHMMPFEFE